MRTSLLLLALLTGCVSYCDADAELAAARAGDLAAIHELGELGNPRVPSSWAPVPRMDQGFDALIPFLDHEDPFVRLTALEGLRTLSQRARDVQRDRYPDLFDTPLADPEPQLRWRAAWALGRLERSRPGLARALGDPEPRVAERAAWALGQARDEAAVEALIGALDRDEELVLASALQALARITDESHPTPAAWKAWWAGQRDR
jgi:hypothetical protein